MIFKDDGKKKPVDNLLVHQYKNYNIEFFDVHELVQGGPETGYLMINDYRLTQYRFGTNLIFYRDYLITSIYKFSFGFFKKGNFKPCGVNLKNFEITFLGNPEILFMPFDIQGSTLHYFIDLNNNIAKTLSLEVLN